MRKLVLLAIMTIAAAALLAGCKKDSEAAAKDDPANKAAMSTYDQMQGKSGQGSSKTGGTSGDAVTPSGKK